MIPSSAGRQTRILVVLPNWFGETLFATPFLRALRQARPEARITALGRPACREVLQHHSAVDACLELDARLGRSPAGVWRLVQRLRGHFEMAFILRRSLSRTLLLWAAGIPERVGFDHAKSGWLLTRRVALPTGRHKAYTYLRLLDAIGATPSETPYEYVVSDEERLQARRRLAQPEPDGRPLVVLHPGANWPHKRWAPERFAALGDRLAEACQAEILITGGPADVGLATLVRERMRAPARLLAGQTTLRELAACLEQARLIVSNDTGVLHIAAALGRMVVALYGPTSPAFTGPLPPDPGRVIVLHHPDCCPAIPCMSPDRPPHAGMAAITVDEAADAALRLLSRDG